LFGTKLLLLSIFAVVLYGFIRLVFHFTPTLKQKGGSFAVTLKHFFTFVFRKKSDNQWDEKKNREFDRRIFGYVIVNTYLCPVAYVNDIVI